MREHDMILTYILTISRYLTCSQELTTRQYSPIYVIKIKRSNSNIKQQKLVSKKIWNKYRVRESSPIRIILVPRFSDRHR